jgi:hypothetical protein
LPLFCFLHHNAIFKYTEFITYGALLTGAPPSVLQRSLLGQHRQTWKLREYHLNVPDPSRTETDVDPMSPGDPLRAHIPSGARFRELSSVLEVSELQRTIYYRRAAAGSLGADSTSGIDTESPVRDIIIIGEVFAFLLQPEFLTFLVRAILHGVSSISLEE